MTDEYKDLGDVAITVSPEGLQVISNAGFMNSTSLLVRKGESITINIEKLGFAVKIDVLPLAPEVLPSSPPERQEKTGRKNDGYLLEYGDF